MPRSGIGLNELLARSVAKNARMRALCPVAISVVHVEVESGPATALPKDQMLAEATNLKLARQQGAWPTTPPLSLQSPELVLPRANA